MRQAAAPGHRSNQRYCWTPHKNWPGAARKRARDQLTRLATTVPPYADESLSELDDRRSRAPAAQEPARHLREFSDFGQLPEDQDDSYPVSEYDDGGQDARVRKMLRRMLPGGHHGGPGQRSSRCTRQPGGRAGQTSPVSARSGTRPSRRPPRPGCGRAPCSPGQPNRRPMMPSPSGPPTPGG